MVSVPAVMAAVVPTVVPTEMVAAEMMSTVMVSTEAVATVTMTVVMAAKAETEMQSRIGVAVAVTRPSIVVGPRRVDLVSPTAVIAGRGIPAQRIPVIATTVVGPCSVG